MIERAERPDDWAGYDYEFTDEDWEYGADVALDEFLGTRGWLSSRRGEVPREDSADTWMYESHRTVVQITATIWTVSSEPRGYLVLTWTDDKWTGNELFPADLEAFILTVPAIELGADLDLEPVPSPVGTQLVSIRPSRAN